MCRLHLEILSLLFLGDVGVKVRIECSIMRRDESKITKILEKFERLTNNVVFKVIIKIKF